MMLDDLEIAPIGLGLLARRRPPLEHPPQVIAPLAIGGDSRWNILMTTGLESGHQSRRNFLFTLPHCPSYPQARVDVDKGALPEGAALPFSPL
jgi:hypothetical protein